MITSWTVKPAFQEQSTTYYQATAMGDPHIAGFDGEVFDFHGKAGCCYCFYADDDLIVNAKLAKAPPPHLPDATIIAEVFVMHGDDTAHYNMNGNGHPASVRVFGPNRVMVVRAWSKDNRQVTHGIRRAGAWVAQQRPRVFENLDLSLEVQPAGEPTGVIGQTLLPPERRRRNEDFEVSDLSALIERNPDERL